MSIDFILDKRMRVEDLFSGRLKKYGITECFVRDKDINARVLIDENENCVWVYFNNEGWVSCLSRYAGSRAAHTFEAIVTEFDLMIFSEHEPQYWGFKTHEEWDVAIDAQARSPTH